MFGFPLLLGFKCKYSSSAIIADKIEAPVPISSKVEALELFLFSFFPHVSHFLTYYVIHSLEYIANNVLQFFLKKVNINLEVTFKLLLLYSSHLGVFLFKKLKIIIMIKFHFFFFNFLLFFYFINNILIHVNYWKI